ncbi:unnamed protein product, partial [Staurois parvus]
CPPCSLPGHVRRPTPASIFRVPFPASAGTYGGRNWCEIQICQIKSHSITLLYQSISHTFCP